MVMDNQKGYKQTPDDGLLLKLSRNVGNWWMLAKSLGVSDAAIEQIEAQEKDPQRRCYIALSKWRKDNHYTPNGSVKYLNEQCQEAGIDPQTIADVFGFLSTKEKERMDGKITALEATFEDMKSLTKVGNLPMNRRDEVSSPNLHQPNQSIPESIKGDQFPQDTINQHNEESKARCLVVAIDFGTTYSGYAFSFKHDYDSDPTKISYKQWFGGRTLLSLKAPTAVLIKPDGKTFDSFGYDAESKYAELTSERIEYQRWYFFRRFKMMLGKMNIDRNMTLEDESKKSLPAQTVFSLVISYFKEDVLKNIRDRCHISEDDITWVLTVPAIWNDAAKQFMREAAVQAGISRQNLKIALEPEAASIFCRLLPVEKMVDGGGMKYFQRGSKYMVLDAGGGTVDITVHEVMPGGNLKEIHKASGGAWRGTQVDEAFKQFIISLIGNSVFCRFQDESKEDYLDLFRVFEIQKRDISPDKSEKSNIHIPSSLREIFEEETHENFRTAIQQAKFENKVVFLGSKLRVESSVMQTLFSKAIQNIVSHVKEMMKDREVRGISSILMVGGFSESRMLQHAIRSSFPNVKVIIPEEAGLVVLKGAVVFGHSPLSIAQRVCKYTYGVNVSVPFDNKIHDPTKRIEYEDRPYCRDIFSKHVEIGQPILLNQTTEEMSYLPLEENQRSITFNIFASTTKSPMYVTDEGCVKLGKVEVDILDMSVPKRKRSVLVSMTFGGTEIKVQAREKRTGKITIATVNFL